MAKQTGLLRYSGSMGGVRHFKIKGLQGDYAGLVGGPTAMQIQNDDAFVRTRENMSEFGGCASAGKSIRVGLSQIIKQMSDSRLTGRLTAIMKQINLEDTTNPRGKRGVKISGFKSVIAGINFDANVSLAGIFNAPYTLTHNTARNSATLAVPVFNPVSLVNAPSGATHFRIINAIVSVSDLAYNVANASYDPTDPTLNSLSDIKYSGYLDLNALTTALSVVATLPGSPTMTATTSVLSCIGIEFYQQVGTSYYLFAQGNALRCDTVF